MEKLFQIQAQDFMEGYKDSLENLKPNQLAQPSKNVRILLSGEAMSRLGYEDTLWDLNNANKQATSFYQKQYNLSWFSINGKVYYIEHDRSDAIVDTGLSLTATETTRIAEYAGDIYLTNQTDGLRQIHVMRLNDASPDSGDADVTVDQDGGGRLNAFSDTSGNLRIRGTNEAYSSVTTAGVVTLTGTLSQSYADNDIAITVEDISSGKPKGSKIVFWKERMIVIGVRSDTSVDNANQIAYMSQFASARDLQKVIVFGITGGATEEWIGKAGILKNIVTTRDYVYFFKEDETYFSSVADVDASSGATFPQLLSTNYGCVNEECAADLGSGIIAFLTPNKRIIGIRISTQSGAAVVFPDESFDQAVRNTLNLLDADQSKARMFYHKGSRLLYVQVSVQNNILTLVYDNNIGKWLPPDDNKIFHSFFEKDGIAYATDYFDDTIYELDRGILDNNQDIETVMAHANLLFKDGRVTCEWQDVEMSGSLGQNGTITVETIVNNGTSTQKTILASDLSFTGAMGIGDIVVGSTTIGGETTDIKIAEWNRKFRIAPVSYGQKYQTLLSSTSPFLWSGYSIMAKALSTSILTTE